MKINKNVLNMLFVVVGLIFAVLIIKEVSLGSANTSNSVNSQVTLETNPNPPQLGNNAFIITVKDTQGKLVSNAKYILI